MIAVFILGGMLLLTPGLIDWQSWWIWLKLALTLALGAIHGLFSRWRREFAADIRTRPGLFYRIANEIPFVLMICHCHFGDCAAIRKILSFSVQSCIGL